MDEHLMRNVADYFRAQDTHALLRLYHEGGHSEEGREALRRLLTEHHVSLPAPPLKAGSKCAWLHGFFGAVLPRFRATPSPALDILQIDEFWDIGMDINVMTALDTRGPKPEGFGTCDGFSKTDIFGAG